MSTRNIIIAVGLLLVCVLGLATCNSCSHRGYPVQSGYAPGYAPPVAAAPVYQQPAPVIVQNGGGHSGMGDAVVGAMAGAAIGNALSRPAAPTVINRTVINRTYVRPSNSYRSVSRPSYGGRRR